MISARLTSIKELLETLKCEVEVRHSEDGMIALLVSDLSVGHEYHILEDTFILSVDFLSPETYYLDSPNRKVQFFSFINDRNLDEALIKLTVFQPDERTGRVTFSASYTGDFDKDRFIQFYMTYQRNIEEFVANWTEDMKIFTTPSDAKTLFV